ncbi:MAG: hypothetical protein JXR68_06270 [Bacteroidales bacterium]|nr:hypothetical protein [Bacteroidales bacterium]
MNKASLIAAIISTILLFGSIFFLINENKTRKSCTEQIQATLYPNFTVSDYTFFKSYSITYKYEIDGKEYNGASQIRKDPNLLKEGKITILYNPLNQKQNIPENGGDFNKVLYIIMILIFLIIPIGVVYYSISNKIEKRKKKH